jgi:hypothetical protein
MTAWGGSDIVLLMLLGVMVVIITIRVAAREYRLKQEALAKQARDPIRRSASGGSTRRSRGERSSSPGSAEGGLAGR